MDENFLERGIHRFALLLGQVEPGSEQFIRLGLFHGPEVQIAELRCPK
jgi:hypothetical protein